GKSIQIHIISLYFLLDLSDNNNNEGGGDGCSCVSNQIRAVQYEELLKKKEEEREKRENEISELNTKMKQAQIDCDEVQETLQEQMNKLEETEKRRMTGGSEVANVVKKKIKELQTELEKLQFDVIAEDETLKHETGLREKAEAEVAAMTRRIRLLEEDLEVSSSRLTETLTKLEEASKTAEESERTWRQVQNKMDTYDKKVEQLKKAVEDATEAAKETDKKYKEVIIFGILLCLNGRKDLEIRSIADDERLNQLEDQQKEAKYIAEDADRKYDEAARKLAIAEVDFERAEARLEAAESKIVELEEELRVVGNNMKALEISEQESAQREESYEETIRDLTERLKASAEIEKNLEERINVLTHHVKEAEQRATEAERQVSKLQNEVDHLEGGIFLCSPLSMIEIKLGIYAQQTVWLCYVKHLFQAEYRADSAEAEVNRRTMDIKKAKERIITERAMYETLRKEMDTMINEFHSI
ncbi:Tropomyosin, partial [Schistosoma japonicum]